MDEVIKDFGLHPFFGGNGPIGLYEKPHRSAKLGPAFTELLLAYAWLSVSEKGGIELRTKMKQNQRGPRVFQSVLRALPNRSRRLLRRLSETSANCISADKPVRPLAELHPENPLPVFLSLCSSLFSFGSFGR